MHPGPSGHQLLAREMATQLRKRGWNLGLPQFQSTHQPPRAQKILWLIRNGAPWFAKRSIDLLPVALFLMAVEFLRVAREFVIQIQH